MKLKNVFVTYVGWSDPAPMTSLVPFGMNSSSSQLLDLLQALRLGHFFPPLPLHLLHVYPLQRSIRLPKHFKPQLPTSTPPKTLNFATIQTLLLYFVGGQKHCCSRNLSVAKGTIK
jgi:hypothetical protein